MNLQGIDFKLLLLFDAVYSTGSASKAATRLGVSQPAISNGLARLRQLFDDPLFARARDGVAPTARARQLIEPVREALAALQRPLSTTAAFDPATLEREFRIVMFDAYEPILIPPLLRTILGGAPGVSIVSVPALSVDSVPALTEGSVDLVCLPYVGVAPDISTLPLTVADMVVIARRDHPGIEGKLDAATFAALPHVTLTRNLRAHTFVQQRLAGEGIQRRVPYQVGKVASVPVIVARSDLISLLPRAYAEELLPGSNLVIHETPVPVPGQHIHLIWHKRNDADPGHRWLRDQLVAALPKPVTQAADGAAASSRPGRKAG